MKFSILSMLLLVIFSGCATMFAPKFDLITLISDPPGADVYLGAELLGQTPLEHRFHRETFEQKFLSFKLQGYETKKVRLHKSIESSAFLNIGFITTSGGVTCWGIDAMSGSLIKYSPNSYLIDLKPERTSGTGESSYNNRRRVLFSLMFYDNLMIDISAGGGEHLHAYYSMLHYKSNYNLFQDRVNATSNELLRAGDGIELNKSLSMLTN